MTKLHFALAGAAAALALAGCSSNTSDTLNSADSNTVTTTADLNAGAADAANDAANAEADALGNQEAQLANENLAAANPSDADEQNVAGM